MSFILQHLDELTILSNNTTWIKAVCPACNEPKLKINKLSGAYSCYANECQGHDLASNKIRELLNRQSVFKSTVFKVPARKYLNLSITVSSNPITASLSSFLSTQEYIPPKCNKTADKKYTYYKYSDKFTNIRCDTSEGKFFSPQWTESTGDVIVSIPASLVSEHSIYQSRYLQPSIVIVEGEKSATTLQYLGIAGISFVSAIYSNNYLNRFIYFLKTTYNIQSVIVLSDNDSIGTKKGTDVLHYCWHNGIEAGILNIATLFEEYKDVAGFDVYDAVRLKLVNRNNILDILNHAY